MSVSPVQQLMQSSFERMKADGQVILPYTFVLDYLLYKAPMDPDCNAVLEDVLEDVENLKLKDMQHVIVKVIKEYDTEKEVAKRVRELVTKQKNEREAAVGLLGLMQY